MQIVESVDLAAQTATARILRGEFMAASVLGWVLVLLVDRREAQAMLRRSKSWRCLGIVREA